MNDREHAAQVKRLKPLLVRWQHLLGLSAWKIQHKLHHGAFPEANNAGAWSPAVAETKADYRYLQAIIDWNMAEVADQKNVASLERLVIHEYIHCLTDPFKRYAMHEFGSGTYMDASDMERQVSELTLAVQWVYEAGVKAGRAKKKT